MKLGAHMSIAGGLIRAITRGQSVGCQTIQIFTKNNMQWQGPPIAHAVAEEFRRAQRASGLTPIFAHSSYLINLAAKTSSLLKKSIDAMIDEVERADALELPFVVIHPGSHLGGGEKAGLKRIAASLREVISATPKKKVKIALETTAGQGSNLGYRFEHLAELLHRVGSSSRLAVCVDTCHIFAAGYEIRTRAGYEKTLRQFDQMIGLSRLAAIHLNDSKAEFGSRVDRHEHIGRGKIGLSAFRYLLNDPRLLHLPMVLETPKGKDMAESRDHVAVRDTWDRSNLSRLRRLLPRRDVIRPPENKKSFLGKGISSCEKAGRRVRFCHATGADVAELAEASRREVGMAARPCGPPHSTAGKACPPQADSFPPVTVLPLR